jgi:hypothetical protein
MCMSRRSIPLTVAVAVLAGACALEGSATPWPPHGSRAPVPSVPQPQPSQENRTLPSGFPVLEGAVRMPLPPGDPGLIALWESALAGSGPYVFYMAALPAAGYEILGVYPGGGVALIRFRVQGEIWQVVMHGAADGNVAIELRLDRP